MNRKLLITGIFGSIMAYYHLGSNEPIIYKTTTTVPRHHVQYID